MKAIDNITIGQPSRLRQPVARTMIANLVNIVPFCLSVEAINTIARAAHGTPLDTTRLWIITALLALYIPAMLWAERKAYHANFRGAYNMSADGRIALAEHLRSLSLGQLYRYDPGELSSMLITDFAMAETGISHHLPQLMGALVMPVLAFVSLVWMDWRMALALFIALPVACGILWVATYAQNHLSRAQIEAKIEAGNRLEEYLQGIRVIKAYHLVGARFTRLRQAFLNQKRTAMRTEALLGPLVMLAIATVRSGLTLMTLCGVYLMEGGQLSPARFLLFLVIGSRVYDPLTAALTNFVEFRHFSIAGGRIRALLQEPKQQGDLSAPAAGALSLQHVGFGHHDREVLHDICGTLQPGTLTAIVGPSGSGKSTLMKLCARFYDPQQGSITYRGVPLCTLAPESYLQQVAMVFQEVYLFQDSIRNNIRFGRPGATDAEVEQAARRACCHDFIMQLPQGYDTPVGEGGSTLSGGEKQRISIARALLKDAPIVLLDEATASLDPENEVLVQQAIDALVQDRTVLVIAHRLCTIQEAQQIWVMEDGAIVERGTHATLMAAGGLYAKLWHLQHHAHQWQL